MTTGKLARKYYTLFGIDFESGEWEQVFGAYTRAECREEAGAEQHNYLALKVIKHDDSTVAMYAELAKLNERK